MNFINRTYEKTKFSNESTYIDYWKEDEILVFFVPLW